jgi:hypothetical protein
MENVTIAHTLWSLAHSLSTHVATGGIDVVSGAKPKQQQSHAR